MDQRIPAIILLSFLINCEAAGEPGRQHDFEDETDGAAEFNSIDDAGPSTGTRTVGTPAGTGDASIDAESVATPSEIDPTATTHSSDESKSDAGDDPTLDTPQACDGEVPEACLEDITDASHCTDGSTCEKYACGQRAFADGRLEMMRCLERECGVEPAYDLKCVERWAGLEEACLLDHCRLTGNPCTYMSLWGWQAECRL